MLPLLCTHEGAAQVTRVQPESARVLPKSARAMPKSARALPESARMQPKLRFSIALRHCFKACCTSNDANQWPGGTGKNLVVGQGQAVQ
jgi:hypothetical protein